MVTLQATNMGSIASASEAKMTKFYIAAFEAAKMSDSRSSSFVHLFFLLFMFLFVNRHISENIDKIMPMEIYNFIFVLRHVLCIEAFTHQITLHAM